MMVNDGEIKPGHLLKKNNQTLSNDSKCVFTYMNFDKLKFKPMFELAILLDPKIIEDYNITVYEGWGVRQMLTLNISDTTQIRKKKSKQNEKFFIKSKIFIQIIDRYAKFSSYGINISGIFINTNKKIYNRYILFIFKFNSIQYKKLKDILQKNNLKHIKIFRKKYLPKINDF